MMMKIEDMHRQILIEREENPTDERIENFIKLDNKFWKDRAEGKIKDPL